MSRDSLDEAGADRYGGESVGSMQVVLGSVVVIVLYLALAWAVIHLPVLNTTPLRFVVVVPLLLFLPGYAFLSALFPGRQAREAESVSPLSRSARFGSVSSIEQRGITWGERAALSFGLSLVWLPILALVLAATPWGVRLTTEPIFATVSIFVLGFATAGAIRRARLPPSERFVLPYRRWLADARTAFSRSTADTLLSAVLALSMLAAMASIGYALAVPTDATSSSEFYVGTIDESNGTLVYDGYPERFVQGQPAQLTVGIENQEGRTVSYTAVVQFQRVEATDDDVRVLERAEATRFQPTIGANETNDSWSRTHQVTPPFPSNGRNVRLVYLLYDGPAPANPTTENADESVYVWPGREPAPTSNTSAGGTNGSSS